MIKRSCRWLMASLSLCITHSSIAMALTLQGELVQAGFPDELWRLEDAIEFLEVEEFTSLADLRGALHVCTSAVLSVWARLVRFAGAPVAVLRERAVAFGLHGEDVEFLVAAAGRCSFVKPRRAVVHVAPAPPAARIEPVAPVLPPPELLLTQQPCSNLEIATLGPRAAGKLLKQTLDGGMDRCVSLLAWLALFACAFHW